MEELDHREASRSPEILSQGPEAAHACNSCRRRKLRCSRELPACQQCRKSVSECFYEPRRAKPGMKAGALDNIHKRLDILERSFARQQTTLENLESEGPAHSDHEDAVQTILSSLAATIQSLSRRSSVTRSENRDSNEARRKRRRTDTHNEHHGILPPFDPPSLPDDILLESLFSPYFQYVHPWMPIIHEGRFRKRLTDDNERNKLHFVILAMVLVASKYMQSEDTVTTLDELVGPRDNARDWLVSQTMKDLSVENLQALIIIAFDDIGNGQTCHAWPLVGSLSRMVEYLQLTVEHEETEQYSFCQPSRLLPSPDSWTEAEERRRVFWSIFALDRFCSVSMGWNTSLTSDDVRRRLPCDGVTWRKEDPVVTPYFGIWDKSAGRIGNPLAYLPAYPVPGPEDDGDNGSRSAESVTSPGAAATVDMSTIGAFAYCIEATESLSRVTSYFLQQKVNMRDQREFGAWLTRFKELDLRLVHWKMLLPRKWTVNIAQQASARMDPNLTLAHVTHNASMILLHQPIAFPSPDWPFKSRLPSLCSMDTCQTAAIEVAAITSQYLKSSHPSSPLSSQIAFCVFISARALLLYWRHKSTREGLAVEFWDLVRILDVISSRWAGIREAQSSTLNLAAKYSAALADLHRRCSHDESFTMNISGYTTEIIQNVPQARSALTTPTPGRAHAQIPMTRHTTSSTRQVNAGRRASIATRTEDRESSLPAHPTAISPSIMRPVFETSVPVPAEHAVTGLLRPDLYIGENRDGDDLTAISQILLDQQFTGMDRVISYTDGIFGSEFEAQAW